MKKVFFFGLSLILFGCGNSTQDTYIRLCTQRDGGSEKMCSCIYDRMENRYGKDNVQFLIDNFNNKSLSPNKRELLNEMKFFIFVSESSCTAQFNREHYIKHMEQNKK